jgi:small subunit ribosomal protein S16
MILRRYTNANGDQQEICLSQEDWEKVTEESLEMMLGFKKAAVAVVEPEPEAVAEEAPAAEEVPAAEEAPAKSKK